MTENNENGKPIMIKDYIARCCGTCKHGINSPLMCDLSFLWVDKYAICSGNYEVKK